MEREFLRPEDIEARSFEIIREELGESCPANPEEAAVLVRVIHTTADFSFAESLRFSAGALSAGAEALAAGALVITDTQMALAGIDKTRLAASGGEALCFISDPEVVETAKREGTTRARAAVDRAAECFGASGRPLIFAVGNAPTALFRICELAGALSPALVIGVPVGFVNVVESKEALFRSGLPSIAAAGRKGGSNVAAAICNALLRVAEGRKKGRA